MVVFLFSSAIWQLKFMTEFDSYYIMFHCVYFCNKVSRVYMLKQVSHVIRDGDKVNCTISEMQPLRAEPEDIPLDIVYEDEHVIVVNKPAHMVITIAKLIFPILSSSF